MTCLLDLAPEILISIIQTLASSKYNHGMDTDLYRLARTCKALFNITEPFLYTKFIQSSPTQIFPLVRTILEKPEYASRVKMMHLELMDEDGYGYDGEEADGEKDLDEPEDSESKKREVSLLIKACVTYGLANDEITHEQWVAAFTARRPQALFAIIVLSLPNLESFSICTVTPEEQESRFLAQALKRASQLSDRFLSKVKQIKYSHPYPEAGINHNDILEFFYLPSLRRVQVTGLTEFSFT